MLESCTKNKDILKGAAIWLHKSQLHFGFHIRNLRFIYTFGYTLGFILGLRFNFTFGSTFIYVINLTLQDGTTMWHYSHETKKKVTL